MTIRFDDRVADPWEAYGYAKRGVSRLTERLAVELGPKGVRANVVSPVIVATCVSGDHSNIRRHSSGLGPRQRIPGKAAATAERKSVSEFVLESALARAEETLPDRQRFGLNAVQWERFQAALSAPPRPSRRLAKLLKQPTVFERGV